MIRTLMLCMLAGVLSPGLASAAGSSIPDTRSVLEKWVETRQLISRTTTDWQSDKETMEQTLQVYERELASINDQMSKLSTNNTQVEKERLQAEETLKSANASIERTRQFAAGFENKVRKFIPQLPLPLQDILKPLLAKLPEDPTATKMLATERVQVIVGILNEVDKFNNAVNLFSEKRKNEKGEEVAVETVYVGLGAAYFVNDSDNFAGIGAPGANGWDWSVKSDLAPSIREIVQIYRNERPARFVALPASIR